MVLLFHPVATSLEQGVRPIGSRVNFAHVMFKQLSEVVRVPVSEATHVQPEDLLLAVKIGGEAAAYPFPIIGYHHIVHDRLAGEPYVVTY